MGASNMLRLGSFVIAYTMVFFARHAESQVKSDEATLFKRLKAETEYNPSIKPTVGSNDQITASAAFVLERVESLDEKKQILKTFAVLAMTWQDELLQWNPLAHADTYAIIVPASEIWLPEIAMFNSVTSTSDLTLDSKFRVQIMYDGSVQWVPSFMWETSCAVDLRYFPFDQQTCHVQFINWMYQASRVNFTVEDPAVDVETYVPNGEWDLVSATQKSATMVLDSMPGAALPVFQMTLKLRRVPTFFLLNVVIPSILITLLSILVYWLPFESGEKVSLGITILLSFSIVLLMISDVTPRIGSNMPLLSQYIICSMALAGLSLFITVAILNIYHHRPTPVPSWVRSVVLHGLARVLCMHEDDVTGENSVHPTDDMMGDLTASKEKKPQPQAPNPLVPDEIVQYVRRLIAKEKDADRTDQNREEWIMVGKVLDRACLVLFLILITASSVVLFPMLKVMGD